MSWNGEERRKSDGFCPAHITFVADMATIKESLKNIESNLTVSAKWKTALVGAYIAVAIQAVGFFTLWGAINKQVEINTKRLDVIERILFRADLK